jgi:hypothetical protein
MILTQAGQPHSKLTGSRPNNYQISNTGYKTPIIDYLKSNEMSNFLTGSYSDPKIKESGQTDEDVLKDFDSNEESLSEGSEYVDDALRMVEQPFDEKL